MDSTTISEPAGFKDLPKLQQIRYLQDLWDTISVSPDEIPILESHLELAEERLSNYRKDPSRARPALEAIERLANKDR